jgi:hypothetical protein
VHADSATVKPSMTAPACEIRCVLIFRYLLVFGGGYDAKPKLNEL